MALADPTRDEPNGWKNRRPPIGWALLLSLLLNHTLLMPAFYWLLFDDDPQLPQTVEIELDVETSPSRRSETQRPKTPKPQKKTARVAPPPPKLQQQKLEQKPKQKPEQKPKQVTPLAPLPRMKMVETNTPESDKAPDKARFLSDKNRKVERETRARVTNLRKDTTRPVAAPKAPSRQRKLNAGAQKPVVAQTKNKASLERRQQPKKTPRLLRMRQPRRERRFRRARQHQKALAEAAPDGDLTPAQKAQQAQRAQRAQRRVDLSADSSSLQRIARESTKRREKLARHKPSRPIGRHQRKWQRVRSALENFVPEVQPGNQTALGTRAHPFALFIARMHRRIHSLWGFGFLVDLDGKPDRHPMNNMRLWTMVEAVIRPNGEVKKATIVKSSGLLVYDASAIDTLFSAAPYGPTPKAIRSADGNVYLHWRFHRDHRQCGTFGVDPYILTKPPAGPIDTHAAEVGAGPRTLNRPAVGQRASRPARIRRPRTPPRASRQQMRAARTAASQRISSNDPRARAVLNKFLSAFHAGDTAAMTRACSFPFSSQGQVVARSRARLARMFGDIVRESAGHRFKNAELLTPAEARRKLGHLPRGMRWGESKLVARGLLGKTRVEIILQRRGKGGRYSVVGLNR